MPEAKQEIRTTEKRIFEELTFIADHILTMEKLLLETLSHLDGQKKVMRETFRP
ncbi:MAG: hypothetical protein HY648_02160 [Acidobacteria bacterium]|nr:hypothetical protein [Acidobacteriota bacterium]